MSSYKCVQCGLVNWLANEFCKRCQSLNPFFNQSTQPAGFPAVPVQPIPQTVPDYSSPPPPNVFGSSVGTTSVNRVSNYAPTSSANRPPVRNFSRNAYSPEFENELKKAEKQIRNAWISGATVCGITFLVALLFSALASSSDMIPATPGELLISVVIFGGLSMGVYFKSRACAVLLCALFIIDKIFTWASTGKMSGALLAFVFIYYFAYGIQGTFNYQKLMKQKR